MGFDKYLVNVSWLAEIVSVFWWMKLDFTSLNGGAVSKIVFWCVCGIIMALAWSVQHELIGTWVWAGLRFQMKGFGRALAI